jgi:predicted enzyme related to lactoylglutathione lyase
LIVCDHITDWTFGADAEAMLGGMSNAATTMGKPVGWLRCATVDANIERIKEHGGPITSGPMSAPGGDRVAQCVDPQGAHFAVHTAG